MAAESVSSSWLLRFPGGWQTRHAAASIHRAFGSRHWQRGPECGVGGSAVAIGGSWAAAAPPPDPPGGQLAMQPPPMTCGADSHLNGSAGGAAGPRDGLFGRRSSQARVAGGPTPDPSNPSLS